MTKESITKSVTSLPNIGKMIGEKLKKIGIKTVEDFLARDPYDIFDQLLHEVDPTLCKCALASIIGAFEGVPWHTITKKTALEFSHRFPTHKWGTC